MQQKGGKKRLQGDSATSDGPTFRFESSDSQSWQRSSANDRLVVDPSTQQQLPRNLQYLHGNELPPPYWNK